MREKSLKAEKINKFKLSNLYYFTISKINFVLKKKIEFL